jgi:hypothetical protein
MFFERHDPETCGLVTGITSVIQSTHGDPNITRTLASILLLSSSV